MKGLFRIIILIICCSSCSRERKIPLEPSLRNDQLINLGHYATVFEKYLSFPNLFRAAVIKQHNIKIITRSFYTIERDTDFDSNQKKTTKALKERRVYSFDHAGYLASLAIYYYFDGSKIGSLLFDYHSKPDRFGYAHVERSAKSGEVQLDLKKLDYQYYIHDKLAVKRKMIVYHNRLDDSKLFSMINRYYAGPLSVDSIAAPSQTDIVLVGNPKVPQKMYQVKRIVHESDVTRWERNKTGVLKSISIASHPFSIKRVMIYDKSSCCIGFDEVLSAPTGEVTKTKVSIKRAKTGLPVSITRKKLVGDQFKQVSLEYFEYTM
jgi:hypothetical protein